MTCFRDEIPVSERKGRLMLHMRLWICRLCFANRISYRDALNHEYRRHGVPLEKIISHADKNFGNSFTRWWKTVKGDFEMFKRAGFTECCLEGKAWADSIGEI